MKFARSLTRNMPKYLIVFFGLLLVFNVFAFFLTPGIKEGHGKKGKKKLEIENRHMKNQLRQAGRLVNNNKNMIHQLMDITEPKAGKDVKNDDRVIVMKKQK
tara:strand:- start:1649 stop:1954 length:306 start_codon:yes stop_codon:yes gene_type:complete